MNQIDYTAMSDKELKQYFLEHREDQAAAQAFFDRLEKSSHQVITTVNDPEFSVKIGESIQRQLEEHSKSG